MAKIDELENRKAMDMLACCLRPGCSFVVDKDYNGNAYLWSAGTKRIPVRIPVEGKYSVIESDSNAAILTQETSNRNYVDGIKQQLNKCLRAAPYEMGRLIVEEVEVNIKALQNLGRTNDCAKEVAIKASNTLNELMKGTSVDRSSFQR